MNVRRSLAGAVAGLVSAVAVLAGVGTAAEASESHRRISVAGTRHHLALRGLREVPEHQVLGNESGPGQQGGQGT